MYRDFFAAHITGVSMYEGGERGGFYLTFDSIAWLRTRPKSHQDPYMYVPWLRMVDMLKVLGLAGLEGLAGLAGAAIDIAFGAEPQVTAVRLTAGTGTTFVCNPDGSATDKRS